MYAYAVHAKSPTCTKTSSDENAWRVNALSAPDRGLRIAFITPLPPSGRGLGGRELAVYSDGWSLAFVGHQLSELPVETHIRGTTMPKSPRRSRLICQVVRVWGHLYEVWSPTGSHPPPPDAEAETPERPRGGMLVDEWTPGLTRILGAPSRGILVRGVTRAFNSNGESQSVQVSAGESVARE